MSELDELERDLMQAADTWFAQALHQKLQRLIQIARERPMDLWLASKRPALDSTARLNEESYSQLVNPVMNRNQ